VVADLLARGSLSPITFPGRIFPVVNRPEARRLQLRGQPRHCTLGVRTAFPFDPYREPPRKSWPRHRSESRHLHLRRHLASAISAVGTQRI